MKCGHCWLPSLTSIQLARVCVRVLTHLRYLPGLGSPDCWAPFYSYLPQWDFFQPCRPFFFPFVKGGSISAAFIHSVFLNQCPPWKPEAFNSGLGDKRGLRHSPPAPSGAVLQTFLNAYPVGKIDLSTHLPCCKFIYIGVKYITQISRSIWQGLENREVGGAVVCNWQKGMQSGGGTRSHQYWRDGERKPDFSSCEELNLKGYGRINP